MVSFSIISLVSTDCFHSGADTSVLTVKTVKLYVKEVLHTGAIAFEDSLLMQLYNHFIISKKEYCQDISLEKVNCLATLL
jgi:hypothetical protein